MKSKKNEKHNSFMDYVVLVDIPINLALLAFLIIRMQESLRMGLQVAVDTNFGFTATGSEGLDEMLAVVVPALAIGACMSLVSEVIYLILKRSGKQPFLTEKYAIGFILLRLPPCYSCLHHFSLYKLHLFFKRS